MKTGRTLFLTLAALAAGLASGCRKDFPEEILPGTEDPVEETQDTTAGEKKVKEADWKSFRKVEHFPVIRITTSSEIRSRNEYVEGSIRFEDPDSMYSASTLVETTMRIRGRGNTSWSNPKKPYRIKLDTKTRVFGMKANKDWVLIANYNDKSLLRNTVAFEVSRVVEMDWTPHMRGAEVYLNGEYLGLYDLCQKPEVAGEKVDILPTDYYLEIDSATSDDEVWFYTKDLGGYFSVHYAFREPENPSAEQIDSVKRRIMAFDGALGGSSFADPEKGYAAWIDTDTFVNFYIIQELTKNVDGSYRKSTFVTLTHDAPLRIAHVWDFDLALGNCNYLSDFGDIDNGPEGWYLSICHHAGQPERRKVFQRLWDDPAFRTAVRKRWEEVYPGLAKMQELTAAYEDFYAEAATRNFRKWNILGSYIWPNLVYNTDHDGDGDVDWHDEVRYLEHYYNTRLEWLDKNIRNL